MSETVERIPEETLAAARLKLKRRLAALIIQVMAETGMTYEDIEARIGERKGFVKRYINALIDGTSKTMDEACDLATAMDAEIVVSMQRLFRQAEAPAAEPTP
jgi:cyanate lyase